MIKKYILLLFTAVLFFNLKATPPEPPLGKRWVLNSKFSDEFNGTKIDNTKWYDYHPTWKGREPGLFMPSQVKVGGGLMTITGEKMDKDTVIPNWNNTQFYTYNIKCGAVVSKTQDASYGYYETRFKATKTTLSTTFWMSTRKNYDGPESCNDRYGLELDFQECIGRTGDFSGSWFADGMHSNGHFWYTDCDGVKNDLRAESVNHKSKVMPADTFYTYGGWWRDAATASFYFEDSIIGDMRFNTEIKQNPFDQTMGLNMVCETYPFPWIELPGDAELADPAVSTCYYDWVRSYVLVDVDKTMPITSTKVFPEDVWFTNTNDTITNALNLPFTFNFKANANHDLNLQLKDDEGRVIYESTLRAYMGYGNKQWNIELSEKLQNLKPYTVQLSIRPNGALNNNDAFKTVEHTFVVQDPANMKIVVKDKRTETLIANAEVRVGELSAVTNENGEATIEKAELGDQVLQISANGYQEISNHQLKLYKDTTVVVFMEPENYRVKVYVQDMITDAFIKGISITINGKTERVGTSGYVTFVLPFGPNQAQLSSAAYPDTTHTIVVAQDEEIYLRHQRKIAEVRFVLKLDGSYFSNAVVKLGEVEQTSSSYGITTFNDVPVLEEIPYQISKDEVVWETATASFYNDTTINLNLKSAALNALSLEQLRVYPNPASNYLNIQLPYVSADSKLALYNVSGKQVLLQNIHQKNVQVLCKHLESGVYILVISNGGSSTSRKVMLKQETDY